MNLDKFEDYKPEMLTKYRGYTIFIRTIMGSPNGYVLIEPNQNGYEMNDDQLYSIDCHGGITWDDSVDEGRIIGWDTKHYDDFIYMPQVHEQPRDDEHIWTDEEAIVECKRIVDQLIE